MYAYLRRPCCHTHYTAEHTTTCPERGLNALHRLPCAPTTDGWCANHSTGRGPVYCTNPLPLAPAAAMLGRIPAGRPEHPTRV